MDFRSKIQGISLKNAVLFAFIFGSLFGAALYRSQFHLPERKQLQYSAAMEHQKVNHLRARLNCVEKKEQCDFDVNEDYLR
jgi:hypothetical protein